MFAQDPFALLIETTRPLVLSAVRRYLRTAGDMDSEDVMQDVYLLLYTRWRQGKLAHLDNPDAYIYTVTKHLCLSKNRRRDNFNIEDVSEPAAQEPFLSPEDRIVLAQAMNSVPEKYALLLKLVVAGYAPADLVKGLKLPLNTVKSLLLRGKQKLKLALEKEAYHDNSV